MCIRDSGKVVQHRVRGEVNQVGTIEEWNHLDARRQNLFVELLDLGLNPLEGRIGIVALLQQHLAFDNVRLIDDGVGLGIAPGL